MGRDHRLWKQKKDTHTQKQLEECKELGRVRVEGRLFTWYVCKETILPCYKLVTMKRKNFLRKLFNNEARVVFCIKINISAIEMD